MKIYTLIRFDFSRSKEGAQRYVRVGGKIPLWISREAVIAYRDAHGLSKFNNLPHAMDINKVTPKYIQMETTDKAASGAR